MATAGQLYVCKIYGSLVKVVEAGSGVLVCGGIHMQQAEG
jgi:desulfoferrodoxin-like iron-binding protein